MIAFPFKNVLFLVYDKKSSFSVSVVCLRVLLFGFFEHWLQGQILLLLASMIHILMVQQTEPGPLLTPIIGVNSGPG